VSSGVGIIIITIIIIIIIIIICKRLALTYDKK
jgi:hypothetical protein